MDTKRFSELIEERSQRVMALEATIKIINDQLLPLANKQIARLKEYMAITRKAVESYEFDK